MSREAKHLAGLVGHAKLPETHNINRAATASMHQVGLIAGLRGSN